MSEAVAPGKAPSMGVFERYLTLWVALCIVVGIALGPPKLTRRCRRGFGGNRGGVISD
jgi:hypothetical protein